MSVRTVLTAITALFLAGSVQAATVYDESIDGDAGPAGRQGLATEIPTTVAATVRPLTVGTRNKIRGSVHGGDVDNVDIYAFTAIVPFTVSLEAYDPGVFNVDSAFRLTPGDSPMLYDVDRTLSTFAGGPVANLFGVMAAGSYFFSVQESMSFSPATYTASINLAGLPGPIPSVPLPAGVLLLGGALAMLGRLGVRRI